MVNACRDNIPSRFFCETVIADGRRRPVKLDRYRRIKEVKLLLSPSCPHASQTIGLQFHAHLQAVLLGLARRCLLRLRGLGKNSKLALHMMADLVRNHIGFGKIQGLAVSATAKLVLEILEKNEVSR